MLTIDEREITGPRTGPGLRSAGGRSSFRRILVPARAPDQSCPRWRWRRGSAA